MPIIVTSTKTLFPQGVRDRKVHRTRNAKFYKNYKPLKPRVGGTVCLQRGPWGSARRTLVELAPPMHQVWIKQPLSWSCSIIPSCLRGSLGDWWPLLDIRRLTWTTRLMGTRRVCRQFSPRVVGGHSWARAASPRLWAHFEAGRTEVCSRLSIRTESLWCVSNRQSNATWQRGSFCSTNTIENQHDGSSGSMALSELLPRSLQGNVRGSYWHLVNCGMRLADFKQKITKILNSLQFHTVCVAMRSALLGFTKNCEDSYVIDTVHGDINHWGGRVVKTIKNP